MSIISKPVEKPSKNPVSFGLAEKIDLKGTSDQRQGELELLTTQVAEPSLTFRRVKRRFLCASVAPDLQHLNNSRVVSKKLTTMTPVKILGA